MLRSGRQPHNSAVQAGEHGALQDQPEVPPLREQREHRTQGETCASTGEHGAVQDQSEVPPLREQREHRTQGKPHLLIVLC